MITKEILKENFTSVFEIINKEYMEAHQAIRTR